MVILDITYGNIAWNDYDSKFGSDFERVKKTITIEEKSKIVDGLVLKFENSTLIDKYDAQFYKSDKYSFNVNLNTFKIYQLRLHELSQIDKNSLEYLILYCCMCRLYYMNRHIHSFYILHIL